MPGYRNSTENFNSKNRKGDLSSGGNMGKCVFDTVVSCPECSLEDLEKIFKEVFGYLSKQKNEKGTKTKIEILWDNICNALKKKKVIVKNGVNKERKKAFDYFCDVLKNDWDMLNDFGLLEKIEEIFGSEDIDLKSDKVEDFINRYVFAPSNTNKQTSLYWILKEKNELARINDCFNQYNEKVEYLESPFEKVDLGNVKRFLNSIEKSWSNHCEDYYDNDDNDDNDDNGDEF